MSSHFGVRLTQTDIDEEYTSETLREILAKKVSCRHTSRVAQLYIALCRSPGRRFTSEDLQEAIPALITKVFGEVPIVDLIEFGWLSRSSHLPSPASFIADLKRNLAETFNEKRWPKETIGVFRVVDLLQPGGAGSLFDTCLMLPSASSTPNGSGGSSSGGAGSSGNILSFQYPFPTTELPFASEQALLAWAARSGAAGPRGGGGAWAPTPALSQIPPLYAALSTMQKYGPQAVLMGTTPTSHHVAVDLDDFFLMRMLVFYRALRGRATSDTTFPLDPTAAFPSHEPSHQPPHLPGMPEGLLRPSPRKAAKLSDLYLRALFWQQPMFEVLDAMCHKLLPVHGASGALSETSHAALIFRLGVAELLLSAPTYGVNSPPPTVRALHAVACIFVRAHADARLEIDPSTSPAEAHLRFGGGFPRGSTPFLVENRVALLQFFTSAVTTAPFLPQGSDDFVYASLSAVLELWSVLMQPWTAKARLAGCAGFADPAESAAVSTGHQAMRVLGQLATNMTSTTPAKESGRRSGPSSSATPSNDSTGTGNQATPTSFTPAWLWYVVEHHLLYKRVLHGALARGRASDATPKTLVTIAKVIHDVFTDPVLAILLVCDQLASRSDFDEHLVLETLPRTAKFDPVVARVLELARVHLQGVRDAVQAAAQWGGGAVPARELFDSSAKEDAQTILSQLNFIRNPHSTGLSSTAASLVNSGMSLLSAVDFAPPGSAGGVKTRRGAMIHRPLPGSAAERKYHRDQSDRMCAVFKITAAATSASATGFTPRQLAAAFASPESERVSAASPFRKLTFSGARSVATGERLGGRFDEMAQYRGDPSARALHSFEIRLIVWLVLRGCAGRLAPEKVFALRRVLADARNVLFALVVLSLVDVCGGLTWAAPRGALAASSGPLAAMIVAAVSLQGPALWVIVALLSMMVRVTWNLAS